MHTIVFVEGEWDLKFFALVMSNFKQFEPHVPSDVETARIRNFVSSYDPQTFRNRDALVYLVQCNGKDNVKRKLAETAIDLTMEECVDLRSLAIIDSDRGKPNDVRVHALSELKSKIKSNKFNVKIDQEHTTSMSTCTVSMQSHQLKVGIMTIEPNLDELLVRFAKSQKIYRPKKPLNAPAKQVLRYIMNDLHQDSISSLYQYFPDVLVLVKNLRPAIEKFCTERSKY